MRGPSTRNRDNAREYNAPLQLCVNLHIGAVEVLKVFKKLRFHGSRKRFAASKEK